jgi:hypothetical protein
MALDATEGRLAAAARAAARGAGYRSRTGLIWPWNVAAAGPRAPSQKPSRPRLRRRRALIARNSLPPIEPRAPIAAAAPAAAAVRAKPPE